jgi:hypothetical protein
MAVGLSVVALAAGCGDDSSTPTAPTPPPASSNLPAPTVTGLTVTGNGSFTASGAASQFAATVTLSDGTSSDESRRATWTSDNSGVVTVSAQGLVTALGNGDATITATLSNFRATRIATVRVAATTTTIPPTAGPRTPDPAPGQRLPMPDVQAYIMQRAAARPDLLLNQSCPTGFKYVNDPWLDYMVDGLRTLDTRWGYNGKPTRTAADNGGNPVIAAGDEIAYHYGAGPDQNSPDVYLIDILVGHCGPTPSITYRVFTGEEPGFWTSAGRFQ